jgi:hypothetical protein
MPLTTRTVVKILALVFFLMVAAIFAFPLLYLKRYQVDSLAVVSDPKIQESFRPDKGYKTDKGFFIQFFNDDAKTTISVAVDAGPSNASWNSGREFLESLKQRARSEEKERDSSFVVSYAGAQFDPLRAYELADQKLALGELEIDAVTFKTQSKVTYLYAPLSQSGKQILVSATRNNQPLDLGLIQKFMNQAFPLKLD